MIPVSHERVRQIDPDVIVVSPEQARREAVLKRGDGGATVLGSGVIAQPPMNDVACPAAMLPLS